MKSVRSRIALALGAVLLAAGCTNIPDYSNAHAVVDTDKPPPVAASQGPSPGLEPVDLVREYVRRSGNPDVARSYLTESARSTWRKAEEPRIIHDTFLTAPLPAKDRKQAGGPDPANEQIVVLDVTNVGRLGSDRAFVPSVGEEEANVTVRRENGEWRIATPPAAVYVPLADFEAAYRAVKVYYFDQDLRITVPDLRYVPDQPQSGLPARVINTLLSGPSETLRRSVVSPLEGIETRTNVVNDDGAIVVDLSPEEDLTPGQRELIAAQIVMSLRDVNTFSAPVRLLMDGQDLVPGHREWLPTEIQDYAALATPSSDLQGMVAIEGRLRSLGDGSPVPGPAGNGEYHVQSAAQSIDGEMLAVVEQTATGPLLRVGRVGEPLQIVKQDATTITRPTWLVSKSDKAEPREVWTVADGKVVRAVPTSDGWKSLDVNASELTAFGTITELRLSRDGTRVAAIAGHRLVAASVVRVSDVDVSLQLPRTLQQQMIVNAVGVDWLNQETLVVATGQPTLPVLNVSVDGRSIDLYDSANLRLPISAITAMPGKDVVVTDNLAVSMAPDKDQIWRQHPEGFGPNSRPFYPG